MEFIPVNEKIKGLVISRKPGQGLLIASLGQLRLDEFDTRRNEAYLQTRGYQNDGSDQLLEGWEAAVLKMGQLYRVSHHPIFLEMKQRDLTQIYFRINAPRSIQILREELLTRS